VTSDEQNDAAHGSGEAVETMSAGTEPVNESVTDERMADTDAPTGLPDPGFLLNMAAVQLEPGELMRMLIPIFDQYAWCALGFMPSAKTGETSEDLITAKSAIDAVQFLLSRIESELDHQTLKDMQRRLSDLRINYVNKVQQ
jgi:Domain of unknown function (DUF1844)